MFLHKNIRLLMAGIALFAMFYYVVQKRTQTINEILGESEFHHPIKQMVKTPDPALKDKDKLGEMPLSAPSLDNQETEKSDTKAIANNIPKNSGGPSVFPGHVMFEIKMGDWAVSYGDVLLGKISSQNPIHSGQFKPPSPRLWPSAEIPYVIDQDYPYKELVEDVIAYFHEMTPIRFVKPTDQKDGLIFKLADEHCYSYLGRVGGYQPIFLSEECRGPQIIHEILHALGFIHEQSRVDRDQYLKIIWEEIKPGYELQFTEVPPAFMISVLGSPFDYNSIMLYSSNAFSKDPSIAVMKSLTKKEIQPNRDGLSKVDRQRLYKLYGK
ncbi:MAG: M12 family metallopeptidase [Bdellovibrionaceae bacterium]|nr:M12 family metallopeptidase [Pseudobdellovibrionaceae bacterium]